MFGSIVKYGLPSAAALSSFVQMDNQLQNSDEFGENSLGWDLFLPSDEQADEWGEDSWILFLESVEAGDGFRMAARSLDVEGVNIYVEKHGSNPFFVRVLNEELALVCDRLKDLDGLNYNHGQFERASAIIEQLLRYEVSLSEEKWEHLFVWSARSGKNEIINAYLVKCGASNVALLNNALSGACENERTDIVWCLLANGADPNCEAWEGMPLVCFVCLLDQDSVVEQEGHYNYIEVLDMLINAKADVNTIFGPADGKETLLRRVLQVGSSKSVEVLLCAGADPNVVFSATRCYDTEESIPLFSETLQSDNSHNTNLLLFFGAQVDISDLESDWTPLDAVEGQDDAETYKTLPILQSTTNLMDAVGLTQQAAQYDIPQVVAFLNQGAVPFATSRNTPGVNAVQQAVILGNQDLFDILLFSSLSMAANDYGERVVRKYMHRLFKLDDFACLARTRAVCRQLRSDHVTFQNVDQQDNWRFPREVSDRILIRILDPMVLRSVQMFKRFVLKMRQMMQEQAAQPTLLWPGLRFPDLGEDVPRGQGIPMQLADRLFNGIDTGSDVCVAFAIIRSLQQ